MDEKPIEEQKDSAGQDFIKKIGPAGCILFLALAVLVTALCFTAGKDPIKGYEAPQSAEYYVNHLDELAAELNENVLPHLEAPSAAAVTGSTVTVTVDADSFVPTRAAVLRYYDESLLSFATE